MFISQIATYYNIIHTTGSGHFPDIPNSLKYFFFINDKYVEHALSLVNVNTFSCHLPIESLTSKL